MKREIQFIGYTTQLYCLSTSSPLTIGMYTSITRYTLSSLILCDRLLSFILFKMNAIIGYFYQNIIPDELQCKTNKITI